MRSAVIAGLTRSLQQDGEVHIARQDPSFKEKDTKTDQEPGASTELSPDVLLALSSGSLFSISELVILPSTLYAKVAPFLANAPDTVTVVFQSSRKIPSSQKVFKAADWTVECSPLKKMELAAWMVGEAHRLGHNITSDAVEYVSFISSDMGVIAKELEKFSTYLGDKKPITLDLVKKLGSRTSGLSTFELSDAVANGNCQALGAILKDLLEQEQSPYFLLAIVSSYLLQLLEITLMKREGSTRTSGEAAMLMKIHPYPAEKLWKLTPRWTPDRLEKALWVMLKADRDIKTGKGAPELILESALAEATLAAAG
jgi:DNA polymerase-3 subunit delta